MYNDYSKFSKDKKEEVKKETTEVVEVTETNDVVEEVITIEDPTTVVEENEGTIEDAINELEELNTTIVEGTVINCARLNVREKPSKEANVVEVLNVGSEVLVDKSEVNDEFYKVTTKSGKDGYCMKTFVEIK